MAIKERGQAPATSHLYIEHDDHGMEHSCWPAYVTCPGSAPSQCYLAPVAGQLESPLPPWQQLRCREVLTFYSHQMPHTGKPLE